MVPALVRHTLVAGEFSGSVASRTSLFKRVSPTRPLVSTALFPDTNLTSACGYLLPRDAAWCGASPKTLPPGTVALLGLVHLSSYW